MCTDRRSKNIVAVINCVLNHNARAQGAAAYPGVNHEVLDILRKYETGVIQMPCPEMVCLGLLRTRDAGVSVLDMLDTPKGRSCCRKLSVSVVDSIEEFRRNGYTVAAVLGGDVASPGCAIPVTTTEDGEQTVGTGWGVFTKALRDELSRREIDIPIRGIRDSAKETMQEDLQWLEENLAKLQGSEPCSDVP